MKKLISLILALATCLSLVACGASGSSEVYKLGDTVSTDIYSFTLTAAKYTIAVGNTSGDGFFAPKDYNAKDDAKNPYVASTGRTLMAFTYTVTNLDRTSGEFHRGSFVSVKYDGKTSKNLKDGARFLYEAETIREVSGKMTTVTPGKWHSCTGIGNFLLQPGVKETRRAYVEVNADVSDLDADVELTVSIPNSQGKNEKFTFLVTAEDRKNVAEIELDLEMAVNSMSSEAGKAYLMAHMEEFPLVTGAEMEQLLQAQKWQVYYTIKGAGFWSGDFWFEADGRIRDTYEYENGRTWAISGDDLILNGEKTCQMRRVTDSIYILFLDGEPYMKMQ